MKSQYRKRSKMLSLLIGMCVLLTSLTVHAEETVYSHGPFHYHLRTGYVSIAGYLGLEEDVIIPDSIAGKPVSEIENHAFDDCKSVKTITIPETVMIIGEEAFIGAEALEKIISRTEGVNIIAKESVTIVAEKGTKDSLKVEKEQSEVTELPEDLSGDITVGLDEAVYPKEKDALQSELHKPMQGHGIESGDIGQENGLQQDGQGTMDLGNSEYIEEGFSGEAASNENVAAEEELELSYHSADKAVNNADTEKAATAAAPEKTADNTDMEAAMADAVEVKKKPSDMEPKIEEAEMESKGRFPKNMRSASIVAAGVMVAAAGVLWYCKKKKNDEK